MTDIKENEKQLRVAFYLRVSTEEQAEKHGKDLQRQAIELYLKSRGQFDDGREKMVLAGKEYVYFDDISGTISIDDRPAFAQLIEDVERATPRNMPFDVVAVYKVDRFARRLKILLNVIDFLDKYKIQFISVNEAIDTSTPFGRAILGIMGVIAELEVETTKIRTQDGRHQSLQKGTVSYPSFGYTKNLLGQHEILKVEESIVKEIFNLFVYAKKSTSDIAKLLTEQEVMSPAASAIYYKKWKGKLRKKNDVHFWRSDTVRDLLSDEVYIGKFYFNKTKNGGRLPKEEWELSNHYHEPIIELLVFNKAQELLRLSAAKTTLNRKRKDDTLYLLSGLLKCEYCSDGDETKMYSWSGLKKQIGKNSGKYSFYYKCGHKQTSKYDATCPTIPIPAEQVENYIVAFIKAILSNPQVAFEYQKKLNSTKSSVKLLKTERKRIIDNYNDIPHLRKNIITEHRKSYINDDEMDEEIAKLTAKGKECKIRLGEITLLLGQQELSSGYINNFNLYAQKYMHVLDNINRNDEEGVKILYELLHNLIDKIIISTRPFNPNLDRIAGLPKKNQQIPDSITIKLKLPDELLSELTRYQLKKQLEFVVRTPELCPQRDSNPCLRHERALS